MPAGRPPDYKPEYCEKIVELGRQGLSIVEMAAEIGVAHRCTIEKDWPEQYPEFSEAFTRAKLLSQAWWEKTGRVGMIEEPGGVKLNQGIWSRSMAARFPHDWRENSKVENTHSAPDGGAIQHAVTVEYVDPPKE
jgi:transposase